MICCCALAGTKACHTCQRYIDHFGYTNPFYPYKVYPSEPNTAPDFPTSPLMGWVCPKCKTVMAPFIPHCDKCGKPKEA